jgi:hypothetical protein
MNPHCATVRDQLSAYLDGELDAQADVAVRQHVTECSACAEELAALEQIGALLRERVPARAVEVAGLADAVVSRITAEERESLPARLSRAFDDMHLVYAGLCATAAVIVCASLAAALVLLAPRAERADSLRGIVSAMAVSGTELDPMVLRPGLEIPRVSPEGITSVMLASSLPSGPDDDSDVAVAAVVTRDGRIAEARVLGDETYAGFVQSLEESARFWPASRRGVPVAVSLVWVVSHTTVRPLTPVDAMKPQSQRQLPAADVHSAADLHS